MDESGVLKDQQLDAISERGSQRGIRSSDTLFMNEKENEYVNDGSDQFISIIVKRRL